MVCGKFNESGGKVIITLQQKLHCLTFLFYINATYFRINVNSDIDLIEGMEFYFI